jgi:hypothetical protein
LWHRCGAPAAMQSARRAAWAASRRRAQTCRPPMLRHGPWH